MMIVTKMKPLMIKAAIFALAIIGLMVLLQGFHHHHSIQDQHACIWHNLIPASFILAAMLAVALAIGNVTQTIAVPSRRPTVFRLFLRPDLLNLPPPIDQ